MTPEKLIADLNRRVGLPGMMDSWGYPVKIRLDMLTTGIRTPVGIKVIGADLSTIDKIARDIEVLARDVPGTRSAIAPIVWLAANILRLNRTAVKLPATALP